MPLIAFLRLSVILIIELTFSSCLQTSRTVTVPSVAAATPKLSNPKTPTEIASNEPTTLKLGQSFWIGHGKIVKAVFLPGAKQIAIAWGSGVSLNSTETGEEFWYQPTTTNLISFDIQPQIQAFATALADGSVIIFDASNGTARHVEGAQPNAYWGDIAWSPDGELLAFQFIGPNRSDPIYLLEVASGRVREVPNSQTGEGVIPQLIWSPDSSAISVAALGDTCPRFVEVQTGEERTRLGRPGQCYSLPSLLFLPDGKTMVAQLPSSRLDLLRFPDGARLRTLQSTDHALGGGSIEFPAADASLFVDPARQWIATRGGYEPCYCDSPTDQPDHPLVVWDLARGDVHAQLGRAIEPLTQRHRLAATFDGDNILMLYESGEITRWKFTDPQAQETIIADVPARPVSAWTLRWSADGNYLALVGSYGGVDIYEAATGQLIRRFDVPLTTPALGPNGNMVALFDPAKNDEQIYEVKSGRLLQSLSASQVSMGPAFSPDGAYLAYASGGRPLVAELASGKITRLEPATVPSVTADMSVTRLIWSPDGQALVTIFGSASGGSNGPGVIVLWKRLQDGSFKGIYHVANDEASYTLPNLTLAEFNPSSSLVALQSIPTSNADQMELMVYDLGAEQMVQTLPEYKLGTWVNDEELLVAEAQYDTRLTRIDVIRGDKMVGAARELRDNAYAPGGIFTLQMAVPPARGVTIRHWQSGELIAQGVHEALNLVDYGWSPDGRWLASIGDDGTLRIWPIMYEK